MNRSELIDYLGEIDSHLSGNVELYVYGSGAQILLGEELRTSLALDVAGPCCSGNLREFREAAEKAGLPVDPDVNYQGDHIQWIGPLRLALPAPDQHTDMVLWQGDNLTLRTVTPARLIASKLIRYDDSDRADIQFLVERSGMEYSRIREAVEHLPDPFKTAPVVRDNLDNLRQDMKLWKGEQ
jgi:hypothetical protein